MLNATAAATLGIAALATGGVIIRPWHLPEAVWAVAGAAALVVCGLLSWTDALAGIGRGLDVYLFLTGMMLLAELARVEGLFDWLAAVAAALARGSPQRLFTLVYAVGTVVTVLLSNDATAVVLTPAVYAATRAAGASPLPYLLICAFIANAASFALPISNPANLVVFGSHMPSLLEWLARFGPASLVAIGATYLVLRLTQHRTLAAERIARNVARPPLRRGGKMAAGGILAVGACLLLCSAFDIALGWPTFICAGVTAAAIIALNRESPWPVLRTVSWEILPLVAGLFVLVQALDRTGVIRIFERSVTRGRGQLGARHCLGRGHSRRDRQQRRQQSAGRPGRRFGSCRRSCPGAGLRRRADRRRSRAEPVRDRLARDHSLVDRVAARAPGGDDVDVPASGISGHATRAHSIDCMHDALVCAAIICTNAISGGPAETVR